MIKQVSYIVSESCVCMNKYLGVDVEKVYFVTAKKFVFQF